MKPRMVLVAFFIVGLVVGASAVSVILVERQSQFDTQKAELDSQNANLTSQNWNLTSRVHDLNESLLTPQLVMNLTYTSIGKYNFTVVSISNEGVLPKFVVASITPSNGVTIGPWVTTHWWLAKGDSFVISGLTPGMEYLVTMKYTPTPEGQMLGYDFIVPL